MSGVVAQQVGRWINRSNTRASVHQAVGYTLDGDALQLGR